MFKVQKCRNKWNQVLFDNGILWISLDLHSNRCDIPDASFFLVALREDSLVCLRIKQCMPHESMAIGLWCHWQMAALLSYPWKIWVHNFPIQVVVKAYGHNSFHMFLSICWNIHKAVGFCARRNQTCFLCTKSFVLKIWLNNLWFLHCIVSMGILT